MGEPGLDDRTIVVDVEGAHKIELLVGGCVVGFTMSPRGSVTAVVEHDSTAKETPRTKEPRTEAIRRCRSRHPSSRDYLRASSCIWYFANCINGTPTSSMRLLLAVLVTAPTMRIFY